MNPADLLAKFANEGVECRDAPLGGQIGKDGDCLIVVGMQRDYMLSGARPTQGGDLCAHAVSRIIRCLESRVDGKWVLGFTRDYIPSDHCLFAHRPGLPKKQQFCIGGSSGADMQWEVSGALSHLKAVVPRRVVAGFKSFHELIHSPSAFPYTAEVMAALHASGFDRERDESRVLNRLLPQTGCIAAPTAAVDTPSALYVSNVDAPPDAMTLQPHTDVGGHSVGPIPFITALNNSFGGKKVQQIRRMFIVGLSLEEDVLDTALVAIMQGLSTDVYIVADAVSSEAALDDDTATNNAVSLLAKHGVKVTTLSGIVFAPPVQRMIKFAAARGKAPIDVSPAVNADGTLVDLERDDFAVARIPRLFHPKDEDIAEDDGVEREPSITQSEPATPAIASPTVATAFSKTFGNSNAAKATKSSRPERQAPKGYVRDLFLTTFALEYFTVSMKDMKLVEVMQGLENFTEHKPPAKTSRLGVYLTKWAGRDDTRSALWKWLTPEVALKAPFPAGVASVALQISAKVYPQLKTLYGDLSFQVPVDACMGLVDTRTYITQSRALASVRRVVQRYAKAGFASYVLLTSRYSLKECMNHDGMLTMHLIKAVEKQVNKEEAAGTPSQDLLWYAEKVADITSDWKTVLLAAQQLQREIVSIRKDMNDYNDREAFDAALEYSLAELSSLGCVRSEGYFVVSSPDNRIQNCKGKCLVFVTACAPEFSHLAGKDHDVLRYFERNAANTNELRWRHDGKFFLKQRLGQTFRAVMAAFRQKGVTSVSLSPLGCRAQDLEGVAPPYRRDVVRVVLSALFTTLEDSWGFGQVFLQVDQAHLQLAREEVALYNPLVSVVVHIKDAREIAYRLGICSGLTGTDVGYMVCGDVGSVALGHAGGCWESGQTRAVYSFQEDLANTSTYLLQHQGVSPDGMKSELISTIHGSPSLGACIGHPVGVRK